MAPETLYNKCSILGRGQLSFLEHLFKFLKSTWSLISPLCFLTTTKLATHFEYLRGTMILAANKFLISFSIKGRSKGFMGLSIYLKVMVSFSKGILCCIIFLSYVLMSLYSQAKTSANCFIRLQYLEIWVAEKWVDRFIYFGYFGLPMLCLWTAD